MSEDESFIITESDFIYLKNEFLDDLYFWKQQLGQLGDIVRGIVVGNE